MNIHEHAYMCNNMRNDKQKYPGTRQGGTYLCAKDEIFKSVIRRAIVVMGVFSSVNIVPDKFWRQRVTSRKREGSHYRVTTRRPQ